MTSIAVVTTTTLPDPAAANASKDQQGPAATAGTQPAVIVNITQPSASVQTTAIEASASEIDNTLTEVSGANGLLFDYNHTDFALIAAKFGQKMADADKASELTAAMTDAGIASSVASSAGLPVSQTAPVSQTDGTPGLGYLTIGAFTFTDGKSTYSVTPGADGTLVGTKDGQAWKTWQLIDPIDSSAAAALTTLTSTAAQQEAVKAIKTIGGQINLAV